jgi:thiopeptide-type bacteriocin biosynthesis protein
VTYRHLDAALLRAVAAPDGAGPPAPPLGSGGEAVLRQWAEKAWRTESLAAAVELASPDLTARIEQIVSGAPITPRRLRRAVLSLYRYVLRGRHRPTPFGLVAGVAPAGFGPSPRVSWGTDHRAFCAPDAVWLADVVRTLERIPEVLAVLTLVTNPAGLYERDGRLVLPVPRPPIGDAAPPGEVTMRHTRALRSVLSHTRTPFPARELLEKLSVKYPSAGEGQLMSFVSDLVEHGVLHTDLRPPLSAVDALGHLLHRLDAIEADRMAPAAALVAGLRRLSAELDPYRGADPREHRRHRAEVAGAMGRISGMSPTPLAVNLRLDCRTTLPTSVGDDVARAADVLARTSAHPAGPRAWRLYHTAFLDRYGPGAVVPVLHLVDPVTGLGYPAGYRDTPALPAPPATARDELLLGLAQRAALTGTRELVLDDAAVARLAASDDPTPLPHADVRFQLRSPSRRALRRGDYTVAVSGVAPCAGALAGRFLALLEPPDAERRAEVYRTLPTLTRGAVTAQLVSPPLRTRTGNVARHPVVLPEVIAVGEYDPRATLPLEDLAVTADADRMCLVSLSTGRTVEPVQLTAVDLRHFTHPLARFLTELPRARAAAFGLFAWGAAESLPYLPRVRHGRAVLAPATWRLSAVDVPDASVPPGQWHDGLGTALEALRCPTTVLAGEADRVLRLDLTRVADAELLRAELGRNGRSVLREAPRDDAFGWCGGRAHEITVAVASQRAPAPPVRLLGPPRPVCADDTRSPATSRYGFAKLYLPAGLMDPVVARHLPRLWAELPGGKAPRAWFTRYRDADGDHLRLRVRLPDSAAFGGLARTVGTWADGLRDRGLAGRLRWDTDEPETGRYGTGGTLTAAEAVFAADSLAVIEQAGMAGQDAAVARALTAAALLELAISFTGSTEEGCGWLIRHVSAVTTHPDRALHTRAMRLARPDGDFAHLRELPRGDRLTGAWSRRRQALEEYRDRLTADDADPRAVLPSLLHIHHLRAVGIDPAGEATCLRLARSAALSWTERREAR